MAFSLVQGCGNLTRARLRGSRRRRPPAPRGSRLAGGARWVAAGRGGQHPLGLAIGDRPSIYILEYLAVGTRTREANRFLIPIRRKEEREGGHTCMFWHETSARLREAIEVLFVAGPLSLFIGELLAAARARCLGHARRRAPLPGRLTVAASRVPEDAPGWCSRRSRSECRGRPATGEAPLSSMPRQRWRATCGATTSS